MKYKVATTIVCLLLLGILSARFFWADNNRRAYEKVNLTKQVDQLIRDENYPKITKILQEHGIGSLDDPLILNLAMYAVVQQGEGFSSLLKNPATPQHIISYAKFVHLLYQGNIQSAKVELNLMQGHQAWLAVGQLETSRFTDRPTEMLESIMLLSSLPSSESEYWQDDALNYYKLLYFFSLAEYEKCLPIVSLKWRYQYIKDVVVTIEAHILSTKKEVVSSLKLITSNIQSRGLSAALVASMANILNKVSGPLEAIKFLETVQLDNDFFMFELDLIWYRYLAGLINENEVLRETSNLTEHYPNNMLLYFENIHANIFFRKYKDAQVLLDNMRMHFKAMTPAAIFEEEYLQTAVKALAGVDGVSVEHMLQDNPMHRDLNWLIINISDSSAKRLAAFGRLLQIDPYDQMALIEMSMEYKRKNQNEQAIQVACKIFRSDRYVSKSISVEVMSLVGDAKQCFLECFSNKEGV